MQPLQFRWMDEANYECQLSARLVSGGQSGPEPCSVVEHVTTRKSHRAPPRNLWFDPVMEHRLFFLIIKKVILLTKEFEELE